MPFFDFFWTEEIIAHLAEHDVTPTDFERVVMRPVDTDKSESSDREVAFGYTQDGRFLMAVYEYLDKVTILPVTAYAVRSRVETSDGKKPSQKAHSRDAHAASAATSGKV